MFTEQAASIEQVACAHADEFGDPATLTVTGVGGHVENLTSGVTIL
jgi:hypothetical protein